MPPELAYTAAVLAGGRSTRMGRDKRDLRLPDGRTLLQRQLDLLAALTPPPTALLLSQRPDQPTSALGHWSLAMGHSPAAAAIVTDDGRCGPLGGLVACLRACATPHLLVIAVDLPHLDRPTLEALLADVPPGRGIIPQTPHGLEPLCALYPRAWLPHAAAALAAGEFSLQRLLRSSAGGSLFTVHPVPNAAPFTNWNHPSDVSAVPPAP